MNQEERKPLIYKALIGARFLTRLGEIIQIIGMTNEPSHPFLGYDGKGGTIHYHPNGKCFHPHVNDDDIVSMVVDDATSQEEQKTLEQLGWVRVKNIMHLRHINAKQVLFVQFLDTSSYGCTVPNVWFVASGTEEAPCACVAINVLDGQTLNVSQLSLDTESVKIWV